MKMLFGTMDSSDLEQITKKLENLDKTQENVIHNSQLLFSYIKMCIRDRTHIYDEPRK